jgi:hypothetical protein
MGGRGLPEGRHEAGAADYKGSARARTLWTGTVLVVLSLGPMALAIRTSSERALSPLETTLFTVLTFVISIFGSALISAYFSRHQAREDYIQLARPAWRRVVALGASAQLISEAVQAKQAMLRHGSEADPKVVTEWLDAVDRLLQLHSGQLEAAISDWQELLPRDYAELVELRRLRVQIDGKIEEVRKLGEQSTADSDRKMERLQEEISELRAKLEERETYTYGGSVSGGSVNAERGSDRNARQIEALRRYVAELGAERERTR